jgi:hypothetical protein
MLVNGQHVKRDGSPLVLLIEPGWPVTDLPSVASCDAAHAVLEEAISKIEASLAAARASGSFSNNNDWMRRARSALRLKKAALQVVQDTRAKLLLQS